MKALTVKPLTPNSGELQDIPEPDESEGSVLIEAIAVGVDGTDQEINDGEYGEPPPGKDRLVLGHESLGRVLEAPSESGLSEGDMVVAFVRHPDPVPCPQCAAGDWDMCTNGQYTEHGIKGRDGFIRERYRVDPDRVIVTDPELGDLGVLVEPVSVVAKAWDHIERIASRAPWEPKRALITGAGPIGLFAAMIGAQKGLEIHVVDRVEEGLKPELVRDQGWTYHSNLEDTDEGMFDAVIECTGVGPLVLHAIKHTAPTGVMALTGIATGDKTPIDAYTLNKTMVLNNTVVFGSVNAGARHYEQAAEALAKADPKWLSRLVTRRVQLEDWEKSLEREPDDVKTVITFEAGN